MEVQCLHFVDVRTFICDVVPTFHGFVRAVFSRIHLRSSASFFQSICTTCELLSVLFGSDALWFGSLCILE